MWRGLLLTLFWSRTPYPKDNLFPVDDELDPVSSVQAQMPADFQWHRHPTPTVEDAGADFLHLEPIGGKRSRL
jgi:hypothetical protein